MDSRSGWLEVSGEIIRKIDSQLTSGRGINELTVEIGYSIASAYIHRYYNNIKILRWLIDKGADVNCKQGTGITAMMCLLIQGAHYPDLLESMVLMLEKGANVHLRCIYDRPILRFALSYDSTPSRIYTRMLLRHGASMTQLDLCNYPYVVERGHEPIFACRALILMAAPGCLHKKNPLALLPIDILRRLQDYLPRFSWT